VQDFIPGQRWISDAESQMGLGTVLAVEHRTVTIVFLATGETRTYAKQTAPLTRVTFARGDRVRSHNGSELTIESVREQDGLFSYVGTDADGRQTELAEGNLDNFIQLNRPTERLFNGQIDHSKWFDLRYRTLQQINALAHSDLYGLAGCRTSLITHQLYIAHEVANRYAPRVLLADEVGLGKTIEAGLILHHQLLTERARRVLIVVPESLVHQWLVEMLRRFNLFFSIFDEQRCQAIDESTGQENPFYSEQLVLCSLEFLSGQPERFKQALGGDWDLLVVDEAHHLQWAPDHASLEYELVELLAGETRGVLLLTATPEQLGKESHFARLRLLDPDRFPDFDSFVQEENSYEPVAGAVEALLNNDPLDANQHAVLARTIAEGDNQQYLDTVVNTATGSADNSNARHKLVEHLLDRHGTGRVLFRNTRTAVKGFPQRTVVPCPLPLPPPYAECIAALQTTGVTDPRQLLCPELQYRSSDSAGQSHWTQFDPRVDWLANLLKSLQPEKVLVIAASADTVLELADALRLRAGIHAAVFHEHLTLVERDRAAAFFADPEAGSQVLLCSEIGSEGRNFQFAHQMVLFDLPLNPDLLEQRIGRLDRIGQTQTIRIHVPYLENSAQAIMFHWYHEGLNAFEHTCPAGHAVYTQVQSELTETLHQVDTGIEDLAGLIGTTRQLHQELNDTLHRGRDRLLEYNSCRPQVADAIKERAAVADTGSQLAAYMDSVFDAYGVHSEEHSHGCYIIQPGEHMLTRFPGLPDDGLTITYTRDIALANEDVHFLTWEHPMVSGAMDLVSGSELGNTALGAVKYAGTQPGTLMLEALYVLEAPSSEALQSRRYLPPTTIRVVIDERGASHDDALNHNYIEQHQALVDSETANKIVRAKQGVLKELVARSQQLAQHQAPDILNCAYQRSEQTLLKEVHRLQALARVNPNVRAEEIEFFEQQRSALRDILQSAALRLDALRVLVAT